MKADPGGGVTRPMPKPTESLTVERSLPDERLDRFLTQQFPELSRGTFQRLIDEGRVLVNGAPVKQTHAPRAGEKVVIHFPEARPAEALPQDIPLAVIYEDADLIVINKPPDLVVHPSNGHADNTLVNALLHHCGEQLSGIGGVARPGIVHRLDLETSGCLVVAKNDATHIALQQQFATRTVEKTYHAIVCGVVPNSRGEIRAAIARHPTHRKRMAVTDGEGRDAWTSYRVTTRMEHATLVECAIHTGRTHQIRVHFQHLGYPVVGDKIYGKRQSATLLELTGYEAPRQMLHARQLAFTHPRSGEEKVFAAPWPADFEEALLRLKGDPAEQG